MILDVVAMVETGVEEVSGAELETSVLVLDHGAQVSLFCSFR